MLICWDPNSIDTNTLKVYQQILVYLFPMLTTPIFINTCVVYVRLYWFEKRFKNIGLSFSLSLSPCLSLSLPLTVGRPCTQLPTPASRQELALCPRASDRETVLVRWNKVSMVATSWCCIRLARPPWPTARVRARLRSGVMAVAMAVQSGPVPTRRKKPPSQLALSRSM